MRALCRPGFHRVHDMVSVGSQDARWVAAPAAHRTIRSLTPKLRFPIVRPTTTKVSSIRPYVPAAVDCPGLRDRLGFAARNQTSFGVRPMGPFSNDETVEHFGPSVATKFQSTLMAKPGARRVDLPCQFNETIMTLGGQLTGCALPNLRGRHYNRRHWIKTRANASNRAGFWVGSVSLRAVLSQFKIVAAPVRGIDGARKVSDVCLGAW